MNGAGNVKLAAPSTSVFPSKTIVAVAVAERSFHLEPGPLTVVVIGAFRSNELDPERLRKDGRELR